MAASGNNRLHKPRFALEVGVVGNRRFGKDTDDAPDPDTARHWNQRGQDACVDVWKEILAGIARELAGTVKVRADLDGHAHGSAGHGHHSSRYREMKVADFFSPERPRLGVLSSLAAGADQFGVEAAFQAADGGVDVELEAVMPFPAADYPGLAGARRKEFREEEALRLENLVARARQEVRLDGYYQATALGEYPARKQADQEARRRAYRQARDYLLQNADLLIAVFDPLAEGKPAGSVETVRLALERGMPVIGVLVPAGSADHAAESVRIAVWRAPADFRPDARTWTHASPVDSPDFRAWRKDLRRVTRYLLSLPHARPSAGEKSQGRFERRRALAVAVNRMRILFGDAREPEVCSWHGRRRLFELVWKKTLALGDLCARRHWFSRDDPSLPGPSLHVGEDVRRKKLARDDWHLLPLLGWLKPEAKKSAPPDPANSLATYRVRSGELSGAMMTVYRGAFVTAFLLAAVAVLAAVLLLGNGIWWRASGHALVPLGILIPLAAIKIGILIFLIWLEKAGHRGGWQEHAAEFRQFSELLRPMDMLATLGAAPPSVELPAFYTRGDPRLDWTAWLCRVLLRGMPAVGNPDGSVPREVRFEGKRAEEVLETAIDWLDGQVAYHKKNAISMHGIENGLEKFATRVLWVVLIAAALGLGLEVVEAIEHAHLAHATGAAEHAKVIPKLGPGWLGALIIILGAGAAAGPSLLAAVGGILFQSEAKRLEQRSEMMFFRLEEERLALVKRLEKLRKDGPDPLGGDCREIAEILVMLVSLTVEESADWKTLYRVHTIKAG